VIDENRNDRQRAQPLDVAANDTVAGWPGKFAQAAFRLIMTAAM
jgi:hypothetical protein